MGGAKLTLMVVSGLFSLRGWGAAPSSLRLMGYTCAGGADGFSVGKKQFFKPHQFRQKLFEEGLEQKPDVAIAIGDHIYFDLKGQSIPQAGKGIIKVLAGWYLRFR